MQWIILWQKDLNVFEMCRTTLLKEAVGKGPDQIILWKSGVLRLKAKGNAHNIVCTW